MNKTLPCTLLLLTMSLGCSKSAVDEPIFLEDPLTTLGDATHTRWGVTTLTTLGDLDKDGAQELALLDGHVDPGRINVYFGLAETPLTITVAASRSKPSLIQSADVNADGQLDLVVSAPSHSFPAMAGVFDTTGAIFVFYGPLPRSGQLSAEQADVTLRYSGVDPEQLAVADLTGDARPDLIIANSSTLRIFDHPFEQTGTLSDPLEIRVEGEGYVFGGAISIGDFNGDQRPDIARGVPGSGLDDGVDGAVFFYFGPLDPDVTRTASANADAIWIGDPQHQGVGSSLLNLGDLDNDGRDDLAISAREALSTTFEMQHEGIVSLVSGAPQGTEQLSQGAYASYRGELIGDLVGAHVSAGDWNADGQLDLVITNSRNERRDLLGEPALPRPVYVVYGPHQGERSLSDADETIWERGGTDYVDVGGAAFADLDADGKPELCLAAWGAKREETRTGALFIFKR